MKKNNRAYAIGWAVLLASIVIAVALGQARRPGQIVPQPQPDYNTAAYARFVSDQADVLTDEQEETVCQYNAAWDAKYGVTVAFLAPATDIEDLEGYAYTWGDAAGLDERDAVLIYNRTQDSYYVAPGEEFGGALTASAQNKLAAALDNTGVAFGQAAADFYGVMDGVLARELGGHSSSGYADPGSGAAVVMMVILFLVVLFLVLSAVESARFGAYRAQYYGVMSPPVVYRPIFFWHGPGSGWYRRHWRPAPPPPPPGGPRRPSSGGGFGGSRTGSSSGGFHRPAGGGFGGVRSGGTRSGGGFRSGGSRGGFGGSRGGGFGGRR